jgi:hypothetical protein
VPKPIVSTKHLIRSYVIPVVLVAVAACGALLGIFGGATEAAPAQLRMGTGQSPAAASTFQSKLMELSTTGPARNRSLRPITITDDEVNSYIKYDRPEFLPAGVRDLALHIKPDGIHGEANVNFDQLKPSQELGNQLGARLLASVFQGTQHLTALGVLETKDGTGTLAIRDVHIGSTTLSDWLVNWLIQTYVESEYKLDLSKPFLLPNHVTRIELGSGKATFIRGIIPKK